MDFLASEIANKKSNLSAASSAKKKKRKYLTNGAIRAKEDELERKKELEKRKKAKSRADETAGSEKQTTEEHAETNVAVNGKVSGRHDGVSSVSISDQLELERMKSSGSTLSSVQRKLRILNIPVRLFGESNDAVFLRFIGIERQRIEEGADEFALGKDNVRNAEGEGFSKPYVLGGEEIGDGNKGMKEEEKEEKEKDDYMDGDFKDDPHKEIYSYFKGLLKQWSAEVRQQDAKWRAKFVSRRKGCDEDIFPQLNLRSTCNKNRLLTPLPSSVSP
jgi:hypothetical protein